MTTSVEQNELLCWKSNVRIPVIVIAEKNCSKCSVKTVHFADEKNLPLCSVKTVQTFYRSPATPVLYHISTTRRALNYEEIESEYSLNDEEENDKLLSSPQEEKVIASSSSATLSRITLVPDAITKNAEVLALSSMLEVQRVTAYGYLKYWKRVYCELHWAGVIAIFKSQSSCGAQQVIVLSKYKANVSDSTTFEFELRPRNDQDFFETVRCRTDSRQKMHDWIRAVNSSLVFPQGPIEDWVEQLRVQPPIPFDQGDVALKSHGYRTSFSGVVLPRERPSLCRIHQSPFSSRSRQTLHLIFVRHGQSSNMHFRTHDREKRLTLRGKDQSEVTGAFLKQFFQARQVRMVDDLVSIFHSGLSRASETANIIYKHLGKTMIGKGRVDPSAKMYTSSLVSEGIPTGMPVEDRDGYRIARLKMAYQLLCLLQFRWEHCTQTGEICAASPMDNETVEKEQEEFQKMFHPEESDQRYRDRYRIVVCHARVIHYFVCRALGMDPDTLHGEIAINHCSLTQLSITPQGQIILNGVNQIAHLPPKLQTQK